MNGNKILFISPLLSRSGYGEHAREIADVLKKFDTYFYCTSWGSNPEKKNITIDKNITSKLVGEIKTNEYDVCIQLGMPTEFKSIGKYNVGITAGVETDVCPQSFLSGYNKMDLVIVPSSFTKSTIMNSEYILNNGDVLKCHTEVVVIPEYANETFHSTPSGNYSEIETRLNSVDEDFCFLFTGQWVSSQHDDGGRKNVDSLIKTFCNFFSKNKNTGLILKTNGTDFSLTDKVDIISRIKNICAEIDQKPSIYLIHGDLSTDEMSYLFNHDKIKCHISHTRGEGFGRPLLEASFTGKPIIAPKWSGHLDFLCKKNSLLIPGKLKEVGVVNKYFCKDAKWFDVDINKSFEMMQDLYENYDKYENRAKKLKKINVDKFSKESINSMYTDALEKYIPSKVENVEFKLPTIT